MRTISWSDGNARLWTAALLVVALVAAGGVLFAATQKGETKPAAKPAHTGAELYAVNCNRCHAERYATERTDAQWKTIMLHMRTRAQIPATDAKAILKYLQENN